MVMLTDRAPIERVRKLADGRIAAVARFARSGVYTYTGRELGRPELSNVNVYRPESEVFSEDAMASFAHKAITLDHPAEPVSAANWRKVSVGYTEGRVARDGGFVEIPLMLADADAVAAFERGQAQELSAGYNCELVWGDGVAPDGTPFQAQQVRVRGNHIALVPRGRAGNECRLGDSRPSGDSQMITDAEIAAFRDSPEGRELLAYERHKHSLSSHGGQAAWDERAHIAAALAARKGAGERRVADADVTAALRIEDEAYRRSVERLSARRN